MKPISGVLPWAGIMAVIGGVIWWSLSREMAAGRWLFGAVLLAHGLVHLLFAVPKPETDRTEWPFEMGRSWAITGATLSPSRVRAGGWALVTLTVAGLALAALATVGIGVPPSWWQPTIVTSSLTSALVLIVFFHPQLTLGLGIDAALIWIAAAGVWMP